MKRLRSYFALCPTERALVRRSLLLLPAVAVLLRVHGMTRTNAFLVRLGAPDRRKADALAPQDVARMVYAAGSLLGVLCLPRSLVLSHILRQRGISTEIRLGVSKLTAGGLSAHAWVELDGLPLYDGPDVHERYAALPCSTAIPTTGRP
jgi:hypothetical protein